MTDISIRDLAAQAVAEKAALDELRAQHEKTREQLAQALGKGGKATVFTPDESTELGVTYVTKPKAVTKVVDREAFEAWVAEHHPAEMVTETVTTTAVRSSFVAALIKADGTTPDGELVPGMDQVQSSPALTIKPTEYARELAAVGLAQLGAGQ